MRSTESYSMDSTEAGSSKTEQSPKERASKAVRHEISMKRTHQVQDDPAAAQTVSGGAGLGGGRW